MGRFAARLRTVREAVGEPQRALAVVRERDQLPPAPQPAPPAEPAAVALRVVLLAFCRWCLDLPPFESYATPEEAVDAYLAARAAGTEGTR